MSRKKVLTTAVFIAGAVLVGSSVFAADTAKTDSESIAWTNNNLKAQANQKIDVVEEEINKVNKDTSIQKFNMKSAKARFEDVVFLGDSITEYLKQADILDATNVLAVKGEHITQAEKHLKEIENLKPKEIVILYGANDLNASTPSDYEKEYIKLVKKIQSLDKGVKIYLQAPLPVIDEIAAKKDARVNNENVKLLTEKVKNVARITGAKYLPADGLVTSRDLYEPDGIHFKYGFYKNWLFFLSENV